MKKMQSIVKQDRPREKLQAKGAAALSDFELLQALDKFLQSFPIPINHVTN